MFCFFNQLNAFTSSQWSGYNINAIHANLHNSYRWLELLLGLCIVVVVVWFIKVSQELE